VHAYPKIFNAVRSRMWWLTIACAIAFVHETAAELPLETAGYIKHFSLILHSPLPESLGEDDDLWVVSNRIRLQLSTSLTPDFDVFATYQVDFHLQDTALAGGPLGNLAASPALYRIDDIDDVLLPSEAGAYGSFSVRQNLDRLFAVWRTPRADFLIGRQPIAWGSGKMVNPTDVIAPYTFDALDQEERFGVDAVRLRVPLGPLSEIDMGYLPGRDARFDNSAAFIRTRLYAARTDIVLTAIEFRRHLLLGIDLTRAVGESGFWLEAAYVDAGAFGRPSGQVCDDYARVTAGLDRRLTATLYGFVEYHYNGAGAADPADYAGLAETSAFRDGAVYLLGKHYAAAGLSWEWTPLVTFAATLLVNLSDNSMAVAPQIDYNLAENWYLSAGALLNAGPRPGVSAAGDLTYKSEFGTYAAYGFVSLKYYF
jgi:hypothetical protein